MTDVSTTTTKPWYFYLARCGDGSLYSGICVDLEARFEKHNSGKGAKYTRSRLPVTMVYSEELESQSAALKREAEVKRWSKDRKEKLAARAA
jgi:putative endonuclease